MATTSQRQQSAAPTVAGGDAQQVATSIAAFLAQKNVQPTPAWMQGFMSTVRLNTPLVALQKTALFRLLATDLTTSVTKAATSCFPSNMTDPQIRERVVRGPLTVQILDVEDIGRSCWGQVEAMEAQERGETTKGREVVRVIPDENNPDASTQTTHQSSGPHKLLLQDADGVKAYAMELATINGITVRMAIGGKLIIRDCTVARGLMLLEPRNTEVLGGKVDTWDKKWKEDRKTVLKEKAGVREGSG